jgi:hypothetical protein
MPDAIHAPTVRRFGSFELNPQSGELRKNGMRLRLSGQPFQVLAVLVEHPGELITREELHSKLWPADTFVDFDHGLNNAVARIREYWKTPRVHHDTSRPFHGVDTDLYHWSVKLSQPTALCRLQALRQRTGKHVLRRRMPWFRRPKENLLLNFSRHCLGR